MVDRSPTWYYNDHVRDIGLAAEPYMKCIAELGKDIEFHYQNSNPIKVIINPRNRTITIKELPK